MADLIVHGLTTDEANILFALVVEHADPPSKVKGMVDRAIYRNALKRLRQALADYNGG